MKLVVICIPTTAERRERLETCIKSIRDHAGYPFILAIYENKYEGYVHAIHTILENLSPDALVWCIGDDVTMHEPDTLKRLVETYEELYPDHDGVINPNDGIQFGAVSTQPFTTASIMQKYTHKDFFHNYADNLFTDIMRSKGKYTYVPNITVRHSHWCNELAVKDETYTVALERMGDDAMTYRRLRSETN